MKTLYLYLIALMTALTMPALADGDATRTVLANGCVLIDHGGYLAYERGCPVVSGQLQNGASAYLDTDEDGIGDTFTPDKNG